ncbi:hypothetical protein DYB37_012249, partial [Aphanomyces astaci]
DTAALAQAPRSKGRTEAQLRAIEVDADTNRKCHTANDGYIPTLKAGQSTASKFHNCFRTSEQIFEYLDALVAQNPALLTRENISTTFEKKTIYAYKLTAGSPKDESLYFQSLLHAREWIAGSSNVFALSSILDDIVNKKVTAAHSYNLYFVPIVNIDGYDISWTEGKRLQRKSANEVDLNRNWLTIFKNDKTVPPSSPTYPGTRSISEPETRGISHWLHGKASEFAGWVDVHSFGGLILYPYGDTTDRIGGGVDEKFERLGRNVAVATDGGYTGQKASSPPLEPAIGALDDYLYRMYKKPVLTIEVAGSDFVADVSTIRTRGTEIFKALTQFAEEVPIFEGKDSAIIFPED